MYKLPQLRQLLPVAAIGLLTTGITGSTVSAAPPVSAPVEQSAGSATWSFDDDEREITGLDRAARLDVTIPPGWTVAGPARLDVSYVIGTNASGLMSISVNGAYLDDVVLDRATRSHTLEIPADSFDTGDNVVELAAAIDLVIDRECRDPSHPARRLDLAGETKLTVPLAPTGRIDVADFPAVMEPIGMTDRFVDVHILGPATGDTMSATADVIAAIREATGRPIELDVKIHQPSAFTNSLVDSQRPSVVVGLADDARDAPALTDRTADETVSLHRGEFGRPILVVTGSDGADLLEATGRLARTDPVDDPIREDRFTLLDLAYQSRVIEGPGRDSTVYGFDVPIGGVPSGATISVSAQRSTGATGLDGVGVIVNGQRIGVARFDTTGRVESELLEIPRSALRPGRNLVRIDADFAEEPEGCLTGDRDQSVEIEAETAIELGSPDGLVELDLDDLPFTFRQLDDAEALTIVLPVKPTPEEIADAVDLAGLLGGTTRPGRIALGDQLTDATFESDHLIVLGQPSRQPALARLGSALDLSDGSIGYVVRDDAPGRLVLVISGSDDAESSAALAALLTVETRALMTGGAVAVSLGAEAAEIRQTARPVLLELNGPAGAASAADARVETTDEDPSEAGEERSDVSTTTPPATGESTSTPIDDTNGESIMSGYGFESIVMLLLGVAALVTFGIVQINRRRQAISD